MTNCEFKTALEDRTHRFAVDVFKFLDMLPQSISVRVISYQLGKSASSVGANYREANRAESSVDFKHKVGIVLKEYAESSYWIGILKDLFPDNAQISQLWQECIELIKIFHSVSRTMDKKIANSNRKASSLIPHITHNS